MNSFMRSLAAYTAIFLVSLLSFGQNLNAFQVQVDEGLSKTAPSSSLISNTHPAQALDFQGLISLVEPSVEDSEEQDEHSSANELSNNISSLLVQSSSWNTVSNFLASINDRQAVSLYVLHHSWRSFIA
jgi:hypothetical protein